MGPWWLSEERIGETSAEHGKVVVNRCMSLDGFIAGPGHRMDWGGGRRLADLAIPGFVRNLVLLSEIRFHHSRVDGGTLAACPAGLRAGLR